MSKKEYSGLVSIDLDGVVNTGSTNAYMHVIERSLESVGVAVPDLATRVASDWGTPPKRILTRLLANHPDRVSAGIAIYDELMYADFDAMTKPVPGSAEALGRLKELNYQLAINSSAEYKIIRDITLPKAGIDLNMLDEDLIWTSDRLSDGQEKPFPYALNRIIRASGIPKEKTIMVGDSVADIECANQAGAEPVAVLTGNLNWMEASVWLPEDRIIENITEIDSLAYRTLGWVGLELARAI